MTDAPNISTEGFKEHKPSPVCDSHKWIATKSNFYECARCNATMQITRAALKQE